MRRRFRTMLAVVLIALCASTCKKDGPTPNQPGTDPSMVEPSGPEEPVAGKPEPGEYRLPLIETTDIHGYVVSIDADYVHYRLAYIADKVKDIRGHDDAYRKDRLLLLDGGDLYQGASLSNLQSGKPVYVALDRMEYDAVALGNHEFDWGFEGLVDPDATQPDYEWNGEDCVNEVPVVCANLYRNGNRVTATQDYVVVEKTAVSAAGNEVPVKIGIVGFATDYAGSIMTSQFTDKGYTIREDYSIANKIAAELESSGVCDATILLIHGSADEVAGKISPDSVFDLVLGGHSHRTISGVTGWGLPYLQGGRYCEHYACADLTFTVDAEGAVSFTRVEHQSTPAVDPARDRHTYAGDNAEDLEEDIVTLSDEALAASSQLDEVIGYITVGATTFSLDGSGDRASVMSNWMCDILRRIGDADVAFVNAGGIRTYLSLNGQPRRDITVANVYEIFPFSNKTYVYSITYAELLRVFEYSMTSGGSSLFSRMTGIDCYFTQSEEHTTSSGSKYRTYAVHSLRKDGTVIFQNGTWTGDWATRTVTLAAGEYLATLERTDYYTGIPNPLPAWNETSRLISNDLVDNENAIRVLREEAASNGGHLWLDTTPHFLLYE